MDDRHITSNPQLGDLFGEPAKQSASQDPG
jgi:hypothetical protein